MFSITEFLDVMGDISNVKESKRYKIIHKYLNNEDFYGWVFTATPDQVPNYAELAEKLYTTVAKRRTLKAIVETFDEYEPDEFPRTAATFLFSVAKFALDAADEIALEVKDSLHDEFISKGEARDLSEKLEKIRSYSAHINKWANKIVKNDAKTLSRKSGLPKEVCVSAFKLTPAPEYITKFRTVYFIDIVMKDLYAKVDTYETDLDDIDWSTFFKGIFGKQNLLEVAVFTLLEGVGRIKGLSNKNTRKIWDDITAWALDQLEKADNGTRQHMLDIYIKRLDSMFKNGTPELRKDLRTLSRKEFPRLAETIDSYREKIDNIAGHRDRD